MQTAKQKVIDVIQLLPDGADKEEIIYRLCVLDNIRRGQQDAFNDKLYDAQEVLKEVHAW